MARYPLDDDTMFEGSQFESEFIKLKAITQEGQAERLAVSDNDYLISVVSSEP